jgi:DNA topoisomerase-1
MEDFGLGTKATRPNIIQNLYDRGYVHDDPLVPTEKGMAVAQALTDFASEIASYEMTAELERSMDEISEGKVSKDSVVDSSRDVLRRVYDHLQNSETEFADIVWEGIRTDETIGKCPASALWAARATPTAGSPTRSRSGVRSYPSVPGATPAALQR